MSASEQPISSNLDHATARALVSEHRDQCAFGGEVILLRPGGGWLIFSASHVLPDGSMDGSAGTTECMAMYDADREGGRDGPAPGTSAFP